MHCEFCNVTCPNLAAARQHMLTASHIRTKRGHELSRNKLNERMRQATIHPRNFAELTKLLNLHSETDVKALEEQNFFKIDTARDCKIVRELICTLNQGITDYYVNSLPADLREPLIDAMERQQIRLQEENPKRS